MTKKNDKNDQKHRGANFGRDTVRDWRPVLRRLHDAIEWALDLAVKLAVDIDEDIEAIERTRGYVRAWIEGDPVDVDMDDVLTTLAILFAAIELDLGIDSSPMIDSLRLAEHMLHLPGSPFHTSPTVVIRRVPRRRNAGAGAFTHLAA